MPSRSNYICVPCQKEMQRVKNGVVVEEHREDGSAYKIWHADLWGCPKCGYQCILGFGDRPIAHHHSMEYAQLQKQVEFHIR